MPPLEDLIAEASAYHGHLCPGQVLGVRMALLGCRLLGIEDPRGSDRKRLLVFVESDRCASDAISTVTGCKLGRRTLKVLDYGKLAATFLDTRSGAAVRVVAREDSRERAWAYAPTASTRQEAQLLAYRLMADADLFDVALVRVRVREVDLPGPPRRRVLCAGCGEGVNDGREVWRHGAALCRACAGEAYYEPATVEGALGRHPAAPVA